MPVCPKCKKFGKRRAPGGLCPNCGTRVEVYKPRKKDLGTLWVYEGPETSEIVNTIEELITKCTGRFFKFQNRKPELAMAKTLYEKCGYSSTLALEVLYVFFDPQITRKDGVWTKNPRSLATVLWDDVSRNGRTKGCFSTALSIAKQRVKIKKESLVQGKII